MQVTEISAQGLRREYKVVLPAADLASRLEGELAGMKDKVKINGFRPGKVPVAHLRRLYGRAVMGDIVQNAVNEANRKIVEDNGLRLALEPKIDIAGGPAEMERAMAAEGDLAFTIALETIPVFDAGTFDDITLERQVAELSDEDIDAAVNRMADQNRTFEPKTGDEAEVVKGDRVTIDFVGRIDGEAFEGGKGEDIEVVIGSGVLHSRIRRQADRRQAQRGSQSRSSISGKLPFGQSGGTRRGFSTSRSRRLRPPETSPSTTNSPRPSDSTAWTR